MPSPPTTSLATIESTMRSFGEAMNMFDPLRFRAWGEMGLTTAQLRVLFLVREAPGVTAGELAQKLAVTPPTISGIVDRLVKLDLIKREDDESDRRLVRNFLTDEGEKACKRLEYGVGAYMYRIIIEMDEKEIESFRIGLQAFNKAGKYVASIEPNLAALAMPGLSNE
ncbi:MAG: MarR family winged helix-turn-helix transcriptional regulator [Dehalococcoidia bacterium]